MSRRHQGKDDTPQIRCGRIDDTNLKLAQEPTVLCGSRYNEYDTAVSGNLLFNTNTSLRTIDFHRHGRLLPPDDCSSQDEDKKDLHLNLLHYHRPNGYNQHHELVAVIDNVLSELEAAIVMGHEWDAQHFHYHRSDRVIIIDPAFAELLWQRLEPVLQEFHGSHDSCQNIRDLEASTATSTTNATTTTTNKPRIQPLGFGVSGVDWELSGINPAMRINSYRAAQAFARHRDAQFASNRRQRSIYSLIIYLTDEGGDTCFWIPDHHHAPANTNDQLEDEQLLPPRVPMTIEEEMAYYRALHRPLQPLKVTPKIGRCVIFTHDLIHESLPYVPELRDEDNEDNEDDPMVKVVLRTDIVARTVGDAQPHFATRQEVEDYQQALQLFHDAEQIELQRANYCANYALYECYDSSEDDDEEGPYLSPQARVRFLDQHAEEYYSKSMYLRYRYPRALFQEAQEEEASKGNTASDCFTVEQVFDLLGTDPTIRVLEYLTPAEVQQLGVMCPALQSTMDALEAIRNRRAMEFCAKSPIDVITLPVQGPRGSASMTFRLRTMLDFHEHYEAWCRVAAVLVLYKVTHATTTSNLNHERKAGAAPPWYCARFMPQTGKVLAVPLERLLQDAFDNVACYGAFFGIVSQQEQPHLPSPASSQEPTQKTTNPEQNAQGDFECSVDRTIMRRDFGIEFVGQNLFEHVSIDVRRWAPSTGRLHGVEDDVVRTINVVSPFLELHRTGDDLRKCYPNLPAQGSGPSRHVFSQSRECGLYQMTDHVNTDRFCIRSKEEVDRTENTVVMNQCIFNFDAYRFDVRPVVPQEGGQQDQPLTRYHVSINEMVQQVSPFYHAAAECCSAALMVDKTLVYNGGSFAFQSRSSNPTNDKNYLRVTPTLVSPDADSVEAEREWLVTCSWTHMHFPVVL